MFEHWYHFAPQMAPQIGVPADVMVTAHDIVCSVMGTEWIERQGARIDVRARSIADVHPLFRALTGGTELSIVEVCELAAYLVAFKFDPRLGEAIISLRDPSKYAPTFTELSIAWKFRLAGAAVTLAPATVRGTADFMAEIEGTEHVVEVSGFPNDPFQSDSMAFIGAMQVALRSGLKRSGVTRHVALEVDVVSRAVDLRQQTHKAVVETMEAFVRAGADDPVSREYPFGSVSVRLAIAGEKPDTTHWSAALCLQLVPPPDTGLLTMADLQQGQDTHWLYVRFPSPESDPYKRIRRKLKTEARQLSGCKDGVVLLDSGGLRRGIFSDDDRALCAIAAGFQKQHTSTTAFGVFAQPVKMDGTRGLAGAYFPLTDEALSAAFWRLILERDRESTALWELDKLQK
jgi:hypothetical protein